MNLKILAVAVSLAFGASLLTACGDSGSPKVTRDTTAPSSSPSGSTSAPASSSAPKTEKSASGSTSAPASTPPAASGSPTDPEKKKP